MHWKTLSRPAAVVLLALPLTLACRGPHHRQLTEAEVAEHMQDVAEIGLDSVDATDQQIARVNEVLRGFAPDVVKLRAEHRALASELRTELAKSTIDRDRVEALRQRALDLFDRATQRARDTLLTAAETLTPEQRAELTYKWQKYAD
ncbi:MAG TPA: periplasmic heavy metal sensor [Polyangiaceae bacterium]|nr:periplasmic heavy metal sensor [Polyangiaceae bacterium]